MDSCGGGTASSSTRCGVSFGRSHRLCLNEWKQSSRLAHGFAAQLEKALGSVFRKELPRRLFEQKRLFIQTDPPDLGTSFDYLTAQRWHRSSYVAVSKPLNGQCIRCLPDRRLSLTISYRRVRSPRSRQEHQNRNSKATSTK